MILCWNRRSFSHFWWSCLCKYVRPIISITLEYRISKRESNRERDDEEEHHLIPSNKKRNIYEGMHTVFICFSKSNICTCSTVLIKDERCWFTILYFHLVENYIQSFGVVRITFYIFVAKFVNNMLMIDYLVLTDKRLCQ